MGADRLKGKHAVITGAAGGIAMATAHSFADEGADVVLVDIDGAGMERTLTTLLNKGVHAKAVTADVTLPGSGLRTAGFRIKTYVQADRG